MSNNLKSSLYGIYWGLMVNKVTIRSALILIYDLFRYKLLFCKEKGCKPVPIS